MSEPRTYSTVVAARSPIAYGALFQAAVGLVRKADTYAIHGEAIHAPPDSGATSSAYTVIGANRDALWSDVMEVHGNGQVMIDSGAAPTPTIDDAFAAVMFLTDLHDVEPWGAEMLGHLHAYLVARLTDQLEQLGVAWSWCSDFGSGIRSEFGSWQEDIESLPGDPFVWANR